jgi:DNA-binding NtrC family response regulator
MTERQSSSDARELASLKKLARDLAEATDFPSAAKLLLTQLLNLIEDSLWDGPHAVDAHVRRAMLHLRSAKGYESLISIDREASQPEWLNASTTAWRWVAETGRTIAMDITTGEVHTVDDGRLVTRLSSIDGERAGETQIHLLERDTTHLLAVPFVSPGSPPAGMISIELTCRPAIGKTTAWDGVVEPAETMVAFAIPWLQSLPPGAAPERRADDLLPVVGQRMRHMLEFISAFANQHETLLISGPSGSGKTRLAHWCHVRSPVASGPFEVVDLLAIPEDMQLAEITGWTRGAFTGAVNDHAGALQRADGGTLLIDEIDKLSLKAQAGLLQIMETREYRPLGSAGASHLAKVRIIVGTNADLSAEVQAGRFREDLYYRVNVLPMNLPGLNERRDEIGEWASYMAARRHRERRSAGRSYVAVDAAGTLTGRNWPGNLRQLDNVIRRAYSIAAGRDPAGDDVIIRLADIQLALSLEPNRIEANLTSALLNAAAAFVDEAVRRNQSQAQLKLEHGQAFTGFILQQALSRLGNRKAVYTLFGRDAQIANRNYNREINRELERMEALLRLLGDTDVSTLIDLDDDD